MPISSLSRVPVDVHGPRSLPFRTLALISTSTLFFPDASLSFASTLARPPLARALSLSHPISVCTLHVPVRAITGCFMGGGCTIYYDFRFLSPPLLTPSVRDTRRHIPLLFFTSAGPISISRRCIWQWCGRQLHAWVSS